MIIKIKQWCEGIIIAVIISIIIEMIIPDGKNKKYIKVIIGVYIMFVSLSPLLEFLHYDFNFNEIANFDTIETSQNINNDIKDIYISGIEENLRLEIEDLGYEVESIKIYTDINYENIEKIELKINGRKGEIKPIIIGENKEDNSYDDIMDLISKNYLVDEKNINFK